MNGDPYRSAPQPADRRVINRSGSTHRAGADEQPQVAREEAPAPSAPRASSTSRRAEYESAPKGGSRKGLVWTLVIVLLVVIIGVVGWFAWSNSKSGATGIDPSRYQAVFMTNGQIYFGKLEAFNGESFKMTNVYYPQAQNADATDEEEVDTTQTGVQLFPIVDGVHGPDDEMIVLKSQILYYENLRDDSKVTQLIEQNEK